MKNVFRTTFSVLLVLMLLVGSAMAEQAGGERLSLTTGLPTDKPYKPVQMTLDNEPSGRPQIGMSHADVVYEFECYTNGYTRYLAIFNDDVPKIAEGTRSTRLPALDMYWNFGGGLAHYGGQQTGDAATPPYIAKLKPLKDYDGIKGDNHYYRDKKRKAPHNAVAELQQMVEDMPDVEERQMLKFSADTPTIKGEDATSVSVKFRSGYTSSFKFDADKNRYDYFYNGKQSKDGATGKQLWFTNVIVIKYDYQFIPGQSNSPMIDAAGTHPVEYFIGGKHFTGTYERESIFTTTTFLDDEGNEMNFLPGKTFIALADTSREVSIEA